MTFQQCHNSSNIVAKVSVAVKDTIKSLLLRVSDEC